MDRRTFLQQISGGASLLCAAHLLPGATPQQRIRVGAQTNTWGVPIKTYDHLLEIADALVRLGYAGFETSISSLEKQAGNASQCRAAFESRHIEYVAPHCSVKFASNADSATQVENLRRAAYSAQVITPSPQRRRLLGTRMRRHPLRSVPNDGSGRVGVLLGL